MWQLAKKALKGRQAPREVQQVRRLNRVMNDSTMHKVSEGGWRIVRQHSKEEMTEQQAFRQLQAIRDSAQYTLNLSVGLAQLGATLRYEGSTPMRQQSTQISKLMRRVMGTRKVVVLHTEDAVMTDPGEMAQKLLQHSKRVAQGGHSDGLRSMSICGGHPSCKIGNDCQSWCCP